MIAEFVELLILAAVMRQGRREGKGTEVGLVGMWCVSRRLQACEGISAQLDAVS